MKWWEESWYAKNYPDIKVTRPHKMHCPVCHQYLGDRFEGMIFQAHCAECMTTFTFSPGDDIPTCEMDSKKRHACHCLSCASKEPEEPTKPSYILPPDGEDFEELI